MYENELAITSEIFSFFVDKISLTEWQPVVNEENALICSKNIFDFYMRLMVKSPRNFAHVICGAVSPKGEFHWCPFKQCLNVRIQEFPSGLT